MVAAKTRESHGQETSQKHGKRRADDKRTLLPPLTCTAAQIKQEFIDAAIETLRVMQLAGGQKAAYLYFVLDAGNGYFYVYGGAEPLPRHFVHEDVFAGGILVYGSFSEIVQFNEQVTPETRVDADSPYRFMLDDGTERVVGPGEGDKTLNDFIAVLGHEALRDLLPSDSEAIHSAECRILIADDEVAAHGDFTESRVANRGP
ncbi:MAG: hypothetical protein KDB14_28570 [Planctomycetales bacterium]|nr:hypothetical protein [Planctomycetales bacterium]